MAGVVSFQADTPGGPEIGTISTLDSPGFEWLSKVQNRGMFENSPSLASLGLFPARISWASCAGLSLKDPYSRAGEYLQQAAGGCKISSKAARRSVDADSRILSISLGRSWLATICSTFYIASKRKWLQKGAYRMTIAEQALDARFSERP